MRRKRKQYRETEEALRDRQLRKVVLHTIPIGVYGTTSWHADRAFDDLGIRGREKGDLEVRANRIARDYSVRIMRARWRLEKGIDKEGKTASGHMTLKRFMRKKAELRRKEKEKGE